MPRYKVSANVGFVTNSSSAIMLFPRELLEDPEVKAFLEAFEIGEGFVGSDLWSRDTCGTVALTPEKKQEAKENLYQEGYEDSRLPDFDPEDDKILVIYGDEYPCLAGEIGHVLRRMADHLKVDYLRSEFN